MSHGSPIPSFAFRTPSQQNRSLVDQMQAESERQRKMEEEEQKRLQREMQLEIQRQKLREQSEQEDLKSQFQVEQRRQQVLENQDSFRQEFGVEQGRQQQLDQQRAPRRPTPTAEQAATRQGRTFPDPALRGTGTGDRQQQQLEMFQRLISEGVDPEEAEQRAFSGRATFTRDETDVVGQLPAIAGAPARFLDPLAAAALQVAESPAGAGIPGIRGLRELQAEAGPSGRALGGANLPGVPGVAVEALGAVAEAAEATLPRQRTFGEALEGGAVNPLAAALGSEEEQRKAQAVLEEAGLARSLAFQLVFDPLNLIPGIGFTRVRTFTQLLRRATQATGRGRQAAVTALKNSDVVKDALRAGEAGGGPLRGGRSLDDARRVWWDNLSTAERKTVVEAVPETRFVPNRHDKNYIRLRRTGNSRVVDNAFTREFGPEILPAVERVLGPAPEPRASSPEEVAFGPQETVASARTPGEIQELDQFGRPRLAGDVRGGELPGGSVADTSDEAVVHISKGDPGPPPPDQPPTGVAGQGPDDFNLADVRIGKEEAGETLIRRHQGAIDTAKRIAANEVRDNNKELVRIGLGRPFRQSVVAREEGAFNELNSLLHNPGAVARGERVVPDELQSIYRKLRAQTDWEQAARIDFDPEMALVDDYFFRGWQPPEGMFTGEARGSLGRNPSFKLPRVDATYDEMVEAGFKPLFDNPAEQARYSSVMGIKYREQMKLIDFIKESELALPVVGGPVPKGWRVPRVGPAFEGKPYADGTRTAFTRSWAVPDSLATRLENAYGVTPDFGKGKIFGKEVDFKKALDAVTFTPKRAKLIGSVFQHVDFLTRSGLGAWTGFADAVRRGQPIVAASRLAKWPKSGVDIIRSTFSPNFRARLSKLSVDDTPLWEGRKISNKSISEAGLSLRDETILPELDGVIRDVLAEPKIVQLGKAPIRALGDLERFWRQGLFEGVYPAAILTDIKNNIGPMIMRQHPEATDAQLAGMIAKQANITYSTIPASISVIQNQTARFALTRLFFSLGENEGLLRLFTGAIRGENAAYFRTRWVGIYLGLITLASAIHFASTGKPLPIDRFTPISKNKWGPLPVGYNTNFAAPTLPIRGRGDAEITLDLVGQMDTAFRLLDPKSFLSARTSVPVRAATSQITGKDFFGAPIDTVGPGGVFSRIAQLAQDLFAPIGPGQAGLEVLRDNVEATEGLIQPGEDRLGTTGIGIQASGVNLRAEQTPALLERIRGEVLAEMGITESYADIKANNLPLADQIDAAVEERIGGELELRRETTELRGQETPQSAGFQALEATRERQQVEQLADDTELNANRWPGDTWRRNYADRQKEFFASREQIKEDFQITFDDKQAPSKSVNEAIDAYFDVDIERHILTDGTVDWDAFFAARDAALRPLSSADKRAVREWLRKFDTPTVKEFRRAQDVVDRFFGTPKYKELSLSEGEILDELVNERVEQVKRRQLRDLGIELDTVTAIVIAAKEMGVSDKVLSMALLFRKRKIRDVFLKPERDEILFREQELLAKFYPDFLENQLSRAEEVTLGEPAFEAIAR